MQRWSCAHTFFWQGPQSTPVAEDAETLPCPEQAESDEGDRDHAVKSRHEREESRAESEEDRQAAEHGRGQELDGEPQPVVEDR